MTRTYTTSNKEDAAIAWKAAQKGVSEDMVIAVALAEPLKLVVKEWSEAEGSAVFEAFQKATVNQRDAAKKALGL